MTSQLNLYQGALRILGERKLSSLTEGREARRVLDDIWDTGIRDRCLIAGLWNFATRTVRIEYDPDIEPDFGFQRAFSKPTDWLRTSAISSDEYFNEPLNQYSDEQGYWFADYDTIYVKYISNDEDYGYDLGIWPVNFANYVEAEMAFEAAERITQNSTKKKEIMFIRDERFKKARNTDAMNQPTEFPPQGNWSRARMGFGTLIRRPGGWERG